jgi:hypothetical protein
VDLIAGIPTGMHADILVYDDIVTKESVATAEQIEKTQAAYELCGALGTLSKVERIIGTRYAHNDLYQTLLDLKGDDGQPVWNARIWPATDTGTIDGKPWIHTQEQWDDIVNKSDNLQMVSNQYLQDPLIASERVFDINNLQTYYTRPQRLNVYILVDPAHSKKKGSADTAMAVVGVAGKKRKYLLDGYCHKMSLIERYVRLCLLWDKWVNMPRRL